MEIEAFASAAEKEFRALAAGSADPVITLSLELVALHAEQATRLARIRPAGLRGDRRGLKRLRQEHQRRLPEMTGQFAPWIDPLIARPVKNALGAAEAMVRGKG